MFIKNFPFSSFSFVNHNIWLIKYTVKFYESLSDLNAGLPEEFPFIKGFFGNRKTNYLFVYCFNKNFFLDNQEVQGYKIKTKKVGLVHTFM
jgi:hypothetical protein